MSEYTSRYAGMSHRALYDALQAGDPQQLDVVTAAWKSVEETTRRLESDLKADLGRLLNGWEGAAGREYQVRLSSIGSFAGGLAQDHYAVRTGLEEMRRALADAKAKAEDPALTDDNDSMVGGALLGAAVGAPAGVPGVIGGAIVGAVQGHQADEEQKEQAHQRMVKLVAGLAAEYERYDAGQWIAPMVPPTELPGEEVSYTAAPMATAAPSSLAAGPQPGGGGGGGSSTPQVPPSASPGGTGPGGTGPGASGPGVVGPGVVGPGVIGPGEPGATDPDSGIREPGTTLAGAGAGAGAGAAEVAGAGGLIAGTALGGPASTMASSAGATAAGGLATALPPGGVLGSGPGGAQPGTGPHQRAGSAPGSTLSGDSGHDHAGRSAGAPGRGGEHFGGSAGTRPGSGALSGSRPGQGEDEGADHETWLTEDEMVWGDDEDAAPAVLESPAPEPASTEERAG